MLNVCKLERKLYSTNKFYRDTMSIATATAISSDKYVMKQISTVVIDGSAIVYVILWSASSATVGDFVIKFKNYIEKQLQSQDVYLVLER